MFPKYLFCVLFLAASLLFSGVVVLAMGGNPEKTQPKQHTLDNAQTASVSLKELADIYWPDSNATMVQQEKTLKNLLGKKVTWDVTIAQIQREGTTYIIQGQSDKNMLGTFSYVIPRNEDEKNRLVSSAIGSVLRITGIVSDMRLRHIVLNPALIEEK